MHMQSGAVPFYKKRSCKADVRNVESFVLLRNHCLNVNHSKIFPLRAESNSFEHNNMLV